MQSMMSDALDTVHAGSGQPVGLFGGSINAQEQTTLNWIADQWGATSGSMNTMWGQTWIESYLLYKSN